MSPIGVLARVSRARRWATDVSKQDPAPARLCNTLIPCPFVPPVRRTVRQASSGIPKRSAEEAKSVLLPE